jgi:hypothetical protein
MKQCKPGCTCGRHNHVQPRCPVGCTCRRHTKVNPTLPCPESCTCPKHARSKVPWTCNYCGNTNTTEARKVRGDKLARSSCKRCSSAWTHKVPYVLYAEWLSRGCRVCGRTDGRLEVDHDHGCCAKDYSCAKCYRGLLCSRHNTMVGILEDPMVVEALRYLTEVGSKSLLLEGL